MALLTDTFSLPKSAGPPLPGVSWYNRQPSTTQNDFNKIRSNTDGSFIAVITGGYMFAQTGGTAETKQLFTSTNYGVTWTERFPAGGSVHQNWSNMNMSRSGQYMIICSWYDADDSPDSGRVYVSDDYGANWTEVQPNGDDDFAWSCCAIDDDGSNYIVGVYNGRLFTYAGSSWTERRPRGDIDLKWVTCCSDDDGSVLVAGTDIGTSGTLHSSVDSGASWGDHAEHKRWSDCASDANGSNLIACAIYDYVYVSINSGTSWGAKLTSIGANYWNSVATDSTGTNLIATSLGSGGTGVPYGLAYASRNGGSVWTSQKPSSYNSNGVMNWSGCAVSGDGTYWMMSASYWMLSVGRYTPYNIWISPPEQGTSLASMPLVYGDMSGDLTKGQWTLPCINTTLGVYAYAAHAVMSTTNGNPVKVFKDGVLVSSGSYTFDESDTVGGLVISTVAFGSSQGNSVITACGWGKPIPSDATILMENVIDIVYDFLTVHNTFTSATFNSASLALSRSVFDTQGYMAAGVVIEDTVIWDLIASMLSSFLGWLYMDGAGLLALVIDGNSVPPSNSPIIPQSETDLIEAKQRRGNLINQCPMQYAYSYIDSSYLTVDSVTHADISSQNLYGVRRPVSAYELLWCRDMTSAQRMQDIIVSRYRYPVYEIEFTERSLRHLYVDVGDTVAYSIDTLYDNQGLKLMNQLWKIISISPNFLNASITFRAIQTNYYLLDGTSRDMTVY